MTLPALYLDEDAQSDALIRALRARGMNILTTSEANSATFTDVDQLKFATDQNRVLITYNVSDFASLHASWMLEGRDHAGIIFLQQQRWGPGELARRIIRLLGAIPGRNMRNRAEYIANV